MPSILDYVYSSRAVTPRRCLLYGLHGIGKSTWAANWPAPVFLPTEDGLAHLNVAQLPLSKDVDQFRFYLDGLIESDHQFQTCVVDTVDWLEDLIFSDVCRRYRKSSIENFQFGKGYKYGVDSLMDLLGKLDLLQKQRGMHIVFLSHARVDKHTDPLQPTYDRYSPDLQRSLGKKISEWCDEVFFATAKIYVVSEDLGFEKKASRSIGSNERVIYTSADGGAYTAKNRLGLPPEIPLDFAALWPYLNR